MPHSDSRERSLVTFRLATVIQRKKDEDIQTCHLSPSITDVLQERNSNSQ